MGVRRFVAPSRRAGVLAPLAVLSFTALVAPQAPVAAAPFPKVKAPATAGSFELLSNFKVAGEVAEIVTATPDGKTLLYTNSADEEVGFVDISNPSAPVELGAFGVSGEPTSVAITPDGRWALICVAGSDELQVLNIRERSLERVLDLPGQPDSIAISADGLYAVIAIENQRSDEDLPLPDAPPGSIVIVDLASSKRPAFVPPFGRPPFGRPGFNAPAFGFNRPAPPAQWTLRTVSVVGLAERFPQDPEPEYVAINSFNVAAVTLQENNHIVLIDLPTGRIVNHFSAGTTTHAADLKRDGQISFTDTLTNARREPDAIAWINDIYLVTANEGDYNLDLSRGQFTGGRNFTVFNTAGNVVYDEGAGLEMAAAAAGLYPDNRSNSKGIEPEGVAVARYKNFQYGFVGAERGNFVAVYDFNNPTAPTLLQILRTGARPEGLLPLPKRNLFVTANEGDGTLSIFGLS
jgi:DNA-binding beta-propeller fold protein YncE